MKFLHIRYPKADSWFNYLSQHMHDYFAINPEDDLFGNIKWIKPDLIFVQSAINYTSNMINHMRKLVPGVTIIGHHNTIINKKIVKRLASFDLVLVGMKSTFDILSEYGVEVEVMRNAYEPSILLKKNKRTSTVLVNGGLSHQFHSDRIHYVEHMLSNNIPLHLKSSIDNNDLISMTKRALTGRRIYSRYSDELRSKLLTPESGHKMYQDIADHKIVFNCHSHINTEATNMRMFEVCGVGSLLITDEKINSPFINEKEILTYKSNDQLIEQIKWAINNSEKANQIAKNAQNKILKYHTVAHRAKVFESFLYEGIKSYSNQLGQDLSYHSTGYY